ncbi:MAG TPA: hypothetical protein VEG61_08335 [Candidatus Dormibacteraeota bacterium]|nr:hypothetical protein [Candidatus Dormibacteraeota bacterium]
MRPILEVAKERGVLDEFVKPYGKWKAKISLKALGNSRKQC